MRARAIAKNLSLQVEYRGPIPETIHTDPTRLRQILINLLGNAIKFTERGSVRLVVRMMDPPESTNPHIGFEVIDTGVGMTPQQRASIFKPFSQADNSMTQAIRRHGPRPDHQQTPRANARRRHLLAKARRAKAVRSSSPSRPARLAGVRMLDAIDEAVSRQGRRALAKRNGRHGRLSGRVLLAEDGPDNQRLIAFLLRQRGASVDVAENGQIAVDKRHPSPRRRPALRLHPDGHADAGARRLRGHAATPRGRLPNCRSSR